MDASNRNGPPYKSIASPQGRILSFWRWHASARFGSHHPSCRQGLVFLPDAQGQDGRVQNGEYDGNPDLAEDKRQDGDLADDNRIVGMADEPVGPTADQRRVLQRD